MYLNNEQNDRILRVPMGWIAMFEDATYTLSVSVHLKSIRPAQSALLSFLLQHFITLCFLRLFTACSRYILIALTSRLSCTNESSKASEISSTSHACTVTGNNCKLPCGTALCELVGVTAPVTVRVTTRVMASVTVVVAIFDQGY